MESKQQLKPQQANQAPAQRSVLARLARVVDGAETLADWLGEGVLPVDREIAQRRADICAACPLNQKGNWLNRVTAEVAEAIRKQTELKWNLELMVVSEHSLGTCAACGCHLPLKVWVPLKHIIENSSEETLRAMDKQCWVLNEH